ncbi:MAG TPA: DUF5343 domain-containing protein [Polyangia bacterium]|jgi:hypothetical protein|nr:DUF5343 domain-containing protein [Polyangia bacterium]
MSQNVAKVALPYLATPGSIKTALDKIKVAATPERVTKDFVSTKLQMKGGNGAAIIPYLKKLGFVASDGSPTDIYKRFRNHTTAGVATADAIRTGYAPLAQQNEYFYELPDKDLSALVLQVTGAAQGDSVARQTVSTLKMLKTYADFETKASVSKPDGEHEASEERQDTLHKTASRQVGLGLSYTINLNLPATSDQAVFNAIFRSLRDNLLSNDE